MTADICVLVEGTYPYLAGGVSSWIHDLICNMPDFTFTIVHLASTAEHQRTLAFQLPPNVVDVHDLFLQDVAWTRRRSAFHDVPPLRQALREFHEALYVGAAYDSAALLEQMGARHPGGLTAYDLFFGAESWDLLLERYQKMASDSSFLDFFWTFRFTHLPIFNLFEAPLPPARIFHSPGTGFSGFLGAIGKLRTNAPLILTEHGLYNREREIEIAQAEWIYTQQQASHRLSRGRGFFKDWWMNVFRFLTTFAYDQADEIISITGVNQKFQITSGADPRKMRVIPNGINTERFAGAVRTTPRDPDRFIVGFVGRVVSIKDVKTFIRAIKSASGVIDGLHVYIVGPTNEEPEYFAECQHLVELLELTSTIEFTGRADVRDYYRQLDVLVLTSLSEAQPLVILEGNCAGVPVVATDVGACRELVLGESTEDQALGPGGLLTPVASPGETAAALIQLWRDEDLRLRMAEAGRERVMRFYRQQELYDAYRTLYRQHLTDNHADAVSGSNA